MKLKKKNNSNNGYIMMNDKGNFFAGFNYGKILWVNNIKEAKPLYDDGHKFKSMKLWCNEEIIMDYIN